MRQYLTVALLTFGRCAAVFLLYGIPLSWICKLLEEACLDRAADHDPALFWRIC